MCIEIYATCKPLLEQLILEFVNCQVAMSKGDISSSDIHYQRLIDIEHKCQEMSGVSYEYHKLIS